LAVVATWIEGGCGSPSGGVSLADFSDQLTTAECTFDVRCRVFSDLSLCRQGYANGHIGTAFFTTGFLEGFDPDPAIGRPDFNSVGAIVAAAQAGKARYDGAAARGCLDAVKGLACGPGLNAPALLSGACGSVFTGTLADGDRCISDLQCGTHSYCAVADNTSCDGTCTPATPACNSDRQCASGQACDQAMPTSTSLGTCAPAVPPGAAGQPCGTSGRCQTGLVCAAGTCVALAQAGAPCAGGNPFQACAAGLVCATSQTCMAPAMKGETCQDRLQCGGMFSSIICDDTSQTCVDWAAGGPCSGDGCPYTAFCDKTSFICKPDLPAGSSCRMNLDQCALGSFCASTDLSASTGVCTFSPFPICAP